jgi:predicted PurR-regulated permease PerM
MTSLQLAKRALLVSLILIATVALSFVLWKVKVVLAMIFLGFIIAASMRPGVELLARLRLPRAVGVLLHYLLFAGLVALFLYLVVPAISDQVSAALSATQHGNLQHSVSHSHGFKHQVLVALQKRLNNLPSGSTLIHPAISLTKKLFEILIGVFFTFAVAAYWIFEREHAILLVSSLAPKERRPMIRDTWDLIDAKLGAFVRGEALLIIFVGVLLSLVFWLVGEPYWILVGIFAGLVEIVPVVGPLVAGGLAVGIGLTASVHVGLLAGACVLAVRLFEDYLISPRVMGRAVGLSPLLIIISVITVPLLLGPFYVILALPILAVLATLVDVTVFDKNPAEETPPPLLFPAKETEP